MVFSFSNFDLQHCAFAVDLMRDRFFSQIVEQNMRGSKAMENRCKRVIVIIHCGI